MARKTAAMHDITPASAQHIPLICALAHDIWPQAYAGILEAAHIENLLTRIYAPENIAAEMEAGHRFFLAHLQGETVGYASAYREEGTIWLKKLYVRPSLQGMGLGSALLEAVVSAHLPASRISLLVNKHNMPAQTYYERSGFARSGETPVQMGDFHFIDYIYTRPLNNG